MRWHKKILSAFIDNLQQQYTKQYKGSSPDEVKKLIIEEWEKYKSQIW